jgi:PAS domain S-box-containing protein
MTLKDIRPPEDIPRMLAHPVFRSSGTHELGIWRHRKYDGTIVPMEITSHQIEMEGRTTRLSLCIDVSHRLQAEARLREQAHLLDQVQDAIVVLDLDNRIQFWNKAAETLYGWTANEVGSRLFPDLLQVDRQAYEDALQTALEKGESTGEFRHYNRNGREIIVDSRWTLLRAGEGDPKAILAVNTDVTEKKHLETQLLRAQRLESIGTLASGIAHVLNNILLLILMAAQMIRLIWRNELIQPLLDRIETNAQRGAEVIKQVLTFARGIEGERIILQPRYLLQEVEQIGSETFPRKISISTHLNRDLWPIKGDATQLHQLLLNLCVNARDAMPQGGTLTLSAQNVNLDAEFASQFPEAMPGPYVRLEVSDTGFGIPESVLDNIFDPFFTTKGQGQGTGLGLSTVLGIVRSHGGFIKVESRENRGTTFEVYLPAIPGADLTAVAQSSAAPLRQGAGQCILVVDDEEGVRQVAEDILSANGYRVLLASDGYEALELLGEQADRIDLMLTDIMMPNMDGAHLVRSLRDWSSRIKVIVASGLGYPEQVSELKAMGIQHFLSKPFSARKLLDVIHEALNSPAAP